MVPRLRFTLVGEGTATRRLCTHLLPHAICQFVLTFFLYPFILSANEGLNVSDGLVEGHYPPLVLSPTAIVLRLEYRALLLFQGEQRGCILVSWW